MSKVVGEDVMNHEWVSEILSGPGFVEWDRYTIGVVGGEQRVDIYGWIERSQDEYKDFVHVELWPESEDIGFTTSSARFSDVLYMIWIGEDNSDDHNHCRRVEDAFDIDNATALDSRDAEERDPE